MTIHYHPSIEMLTDYAAGSLSLTHSMSIATHIEQCQECQQQIRKLTTLGAQLFTQTATEDANIVDLKASFFDKLRELDRSEDMSSPVKEQGHRDQSTGPMASEESLPSWEQDYQVPKSLRQFVPFGYDKLKWMSLSPSVKIATLCQEEGGAQVALTRIKAGASIPTHTHTGDEITLVLEGAFSDKSGIYRRGDFITRDASHKHKPMVTKDAECICLTVLDSPIEFTGWLTRLFNPIMRRYHPHSNH